ncbi:hypothetical protein ACFLWR_07340, partial [Chloroflexota bacterium]
FQGLLNKKFGFHDEWADFGPAGYAVDGADTLFFDSLKDALAFLRWFLLPESIDHLREDDLHDYQLSEIEEILSKYSDRAALAIQMRELISLVDSALTDIQEPSIEQVEAILDIFNDFVGSFSLQHEIVTSGSPIKLLNSPYFTTLLDEELEEDEENETSRKSARELKRLLNSGTFQLDNVDHLEIAAHFLTRHNRSG